MCERQRYGRSSGPLQMIWHRSEKKSKICAVGANVACGGDHQHAADLLTQGIASSDLGHYTQAITLLGEAMGALHTAVPSNGADPPVSWNAHRTRPALRTDLVESQLSDSRDGSNEPKVSSYW
jgi:hypothetical protein